MIYWREAFLSALEEADISFPSDEKIEAAANVLEVAHENYGMAHGHDCIPNPLKVENETLKKELCSERDKQHCRECDGQGRITIAGPYHSSNSECWKCRGEGRVAC